VARYVKAMSIDANIALLNSRSLLRLTGKDRFTFLQNLVSQDMAIAEAGRPLFSAFLTPQGKYLFDFFVIPEGDSLLLDVETDRRDDFMSRLSRYRLRADIELKNVFGEYDVFALWDEEPLPGVFTDPRLPELGHRLITKKGSGPQTTVHEAEYKNHRYEWGVAEGGHEIPQGDATLLEVNFDVLNAISFTKGCYLGQELTARTHYRGLIKRRYLPFRFEGQAPQPSHAILHNGFEMGEVRAVGEGVGIGLFHLEGVRPYLNGELLVHDGVSYEVFVPEYLKSVTTAK
jgi:tRNA-modifying protein YgfZ